jgi:flagellin
MSLSINTNIAATRASQYLASNHQNLQKSLDRLSSGKRITGPADDAGGLAVSMKLEHSINGLKGVANGISNGISVLQVQDGVLQSVADMVTRIGELKSMYDDVSKSSSDKDLYDNELQDLGAQITQIVTNTKLNDVVLIDVAGSADAKTVQLDTSGSNSMTITDDNFLAGAGMAKLVLATASFDSTAAGAVATSDITAALNEVAALRAGNGGEVKRLEYALASVNTQITNLTAANGRIVDVDIATESANLARQQILVQASASMVAQANVANNVALQLLQ